MTVQIFALTYLPITLNDSEDDTCIIFRDNCSEQLSECWSDFQITQGHRQCMGWFEKKLYDFL